VKVLLDEHLPFALRKYLTGHEIYTVRYLSWSGVTNGKLLALAASHGFDALVTRDTQMLYQQNARLLPCSIIVIRPRTNRLSDVLACVPGVLKVLESITSPQFYLLDTPAST
jgi:predicted nuclease of predicted toxin-antitoxin system